MKLDNTQLTIAAVLVAIGVYIYAKQKTELGGWQKGYMVLADQINATPPAQVTK
jgi:hypothetical protein